MYTKNNINNMALEKFQLELVSFKDITTKVRHFAFKRIDGKNLNFIAGQFITFLLVDQKNNIKRRSYSLGSLASDNIFLEIAITYIKYGIASEFFFNMKVGDKVSAMGPAGRLILRNEKIRKLILLGTGTGIVPYKSMFPELLKKADSCEIYIFLGVQYREDALYKNDFINFSKKHKNIHFKLCLSKEIKNIEDHEVLGYVQNQLKKIDLDYEKDIVYACGNPNMIDEVYDILTKVNFNPKNIRREKYISSN